MSLTRLKSSVTSTFTQIAYFILKQPQLFYKLSWKMKPPKIGCEEIRTALIVYLCTCHLLPSWHYGEWSNANRTKENHHSNHFSNFINAAFPKICLLSLYDLRGETYHKPLFIIATIMTKRNYYSVTTRSLEWCRPRHSDQILNKWHIYQYSYWMWH